MNFEYIAPKVIAGACMVSSFRVKGGEVGGLGGGSLEHERQWLDAQWAGLFPRSAELATGQLSGAP